MANEVSLDPETGKFESEKRPFSYEGMDNAALEAEKELEGIPEEAITAIAEWLKKWYLKAGYKRLAKVLLKRVK